MYVCVYMHNKCMYIYIYTVTSKIKYIFKDVHLPISNLQSI